MTGEQRRQLTGLPPRPSHQAPVNSRLIRKNRPAGDPISPMVPSMPVLETEEQETPAPVLAEPSTKLSDVDPARRTAAKPAKTPARKIKVGFYIDVNDAARLRGAARFIPNELRSEGVDGFSAMAAKLLMDGLAQLERTYNNGEPWPSMPPGEELPRGRTVR